MKGVDKNDITKSIEKKYLQSKVGMQTLEFSFLLSS